MLSAQDLVFRLSEFAMGRLTVRDFEDWFVQASWNADLWASPELRDAVYSIDLVLAEYSNRHVSNSYVRAFAGYVARELEATIKSIVPLAIGVRMATADIIRARLVAPPVPTAA